MSIYDKDGIALGSAYDISASQLSYAYDKDGNVVFSREHNVDYNSYSWTQIWQNSDMQSVSGTQSFAVYDGKVFWFKSASNGQGNVYVIDESTGATILNSTNIVGGHSNNASFGGFYAEEDTYPILYVGGASATMMIYENRITQLDSSSLSSTLLGTLVFTSEVGARLDGTISENDNDIMITAGYNYDTYGATDLYAQFGICWWDLTDLTDNGDGTYTPAFIKSVTTEPVYVNKRTSDDQVGVKQSIREHDGYVWIATGYNAVAGYIYAYNETTGDVEYSIDLSTTTEVEGIEFVEDANAVGGYALYVGFQNGKMRKYTFGEVS